MLKIGNVGSYLTQNATKPRWAEHMPVHTGTQREVETYNNGQHAIVSAVLQMGRYEK
jgi:hypothetical protein